MKKSSMRKLLTIIGCIVLIAALALMATGCGSKEEPAPTQPAPSEPVAEATQPAPSEPVVEATQPAEEQPVEENVLGEGATTFSLIVGDMEGNETSFQIRTDKTTVGEALMDVGLLKGEDGPYGLYIHEVNGIRAVYEEDGTYWAFYENGEYAMTGVDQTEINPDTVYSLVKTKG